MRVFVISNYYPPHYQGGYELSCQKVVEELRLRRHQLLVVTSDWQAEKETGQDSVRRLLHVHSLKDLDGSKRRSSQLRQAVTARQDYLIVKRLSQEFQPDVAYVWNMSGLSLAPLMALRRLNVPAVFDLGDYWLLKRWIELFQETNRLKRWFRSVIRGSVRFKHIDLSHLVANSQILKQQYVENGFPAEAITVIPRGLASSDIAEEPAPLTYGREVRLLYVGRLTEVKGVHIAIEAVARLAQETRLETVHLDIVGTGEAGYEGRLRQMVASLGLESNVRFRGHLPHRDLMASYRRYHALLFPAIWIEPFGNVVVEAMAQGLCVIASDQGGPAGYISHGENGLLVPVEDSGAMAQAIMSLIESPERTRRMRQAAIATVRSRYAFERIADRIEAYLYTVMDEHAKGVCIESVKGVEHR